MTHTTRVISIGNINVESDSGYAATLAQSFVQPEAIISRAQRDAGASLVTNVSLGQHVYYLQALVLNDEPDVVDARRRALLRELDATRGPLTVVIENAQGTARRRFMQFVVSQLQQVEGQGGHGFLAPLEAADDVRWQGVDVVEANWTLNESGTRSLTVAGDLDVYPVYTLTPNSAKATPNWPYSRAVLVEWRSPVGGFHPIDVTGGGLDTEALLGAGKIADGSNIAVLVNGVLTRHWYQPDGGANSFGEAQTHIWVNHRFQPAVHPSLSGYVSAADTTWSVVGDAGLPSRGALKVDDEIVSYTSRAPGKLYGVSRGRYGTTAAAHTARTGMIHYPVIAQILYGPNAVTPEAMKDSAYNSAQPPAFLAQPPAFLTHGSSNAEWVYNTFAGFEQPGSWSYTSYKNSLGFVTESQPAGWWTPTWDYPWEAMGFKAGWTDASVYRLRVAVALKAVRFTARHMIRMSPSASPNAPLLVASADDGRRVTLWTEGAGATRENNILYSHDTGDFSVADVFGDAPAYNNLTWSVSGNSYVQADIQQMVIAFDDNYTPAVTMLAEETDYDLDLTIANTTAGESLTVQFPNLAPGASLVIDSALQTVVYTADGSNQYRGARRDASRPRFLRLLPGVNNFTISEAGMGTLNINIQYRPRWYT